MAYSSVQYWFYYPESNTTFAGSDRLWRRLVLLRLARLAIDGKTGYPGFHRDDWEGYQVRVDRHGRTAVRATWHGHYRYCRGSRGCRYRWGPPTGWTRVARGSHAGHIPLDGAHGRVPGGDMRERISTPDGMRLIPLESIDRRRYRPLDEGVRPPWRKRVYRRPEDASS